MDQSADSQSASDSASDSADSWVVNGSSASLVFLGSGTGTDDNGSEGTVSPTETGAGGDDQLGPVRREPLKRSRSNLSPIPGSERGLRSILDTQAVMMDRG